MMILIKRSVKGVKTFSPSVNKEKRKEIIRKDWLKKGPIKN